MWIDAVSEQQRKGEASILVTILGTAGSAPRKTGSKMLVTAEQSFDTIGGGHLEYLIIQKAHEMLASGSREPVLEHFPLDQNWDSVVVGVSVCCWSLCLAVISILHSSVQAISASP